MKKEEKNIKLMDDMYDEPSVFAVSCDKPYVIASDKVKSRINREKERIIKKINIKVEIEP